MSPSHSIVGLEKLETCRKALLKASPQDLQDVQLLSEATEIILSPQEEKLHLKLLELLLALLRQLTTVLSLSPNEPVRSLAQDRLAPEFQPGKPLILFLSANIDHGLKVQQTRSVEVLAAAAKLAVTISSQGILASSASSAARHDNFMVPLFTCIAGGDVTNRGDLSILIALLPYIPPSAIPSSLFDKLLSELHVAHNASVRCHLAADLAIVLGGASLAAPSSNLPSTPEQQKRILLPLLSAFATSQPSSTLLHVSRYLLPRLFSLFPSLLLTLLSMLGAPDPVYGAWVAVASIGVQQGLISIEDLPQEDVMVVLESDEPETRLRAFELVSGRKEYTESVIELIKLSFKRNEALSSAGARSAFSSATYAFFVRLHQYETLARRTLRKLSKQPNTSSTVTEATQLRGSLSKTADFHSWFLHFIHDNLWHARRYPVFRVLLALNLLGRYLEVFGDDEGVQGKIYTQDMVENLLACQASEFTEVRSRARKILDDAKVSLTGYESLHTPSAQALLVSAFASLDHPRKTQAEAGKAALCILFGKVVHYGTVRESLEFAQNIITKLEKGVEVIERDLVQIENHPLHGLLGAIKDVILCLNIKTVEAQQTWSPIFRQLMSLVIRIWNATRAVISLAPSGLVSADENGVEGSARADHEIARAYEVLGGGEEGEEEDGMDHTGLLSGCWRATMTAGELLAAIFILPLARGGPSQLIWSVQDVNAAGTTFLTWLHEIRHRGTFSKLANAFAQLVEAVRAIESLQSLCDDWLTDELRAISSDQHSTTRRSAALPYSILSIVSNSEALLEKAVTSLLEFAKVENASTSNVTKVHALNVLKIVLLDARQTKWFDVWFERSVITALQAFESPDWNVRNVGLILFSTLVHRCLAPPRGGQDYYRSRTTLASRRPFSLFHNKYPLILPFLKEYLTKGSNPDCQTRIRHSPLLPILIIVRSLRWSDKNSEMLSDLARAVEPYLRSREYQIRQTAAQALSSTVSPSEALQRALSIENYLSPSPEMANETHGYICFLRQLISNFIEWETVHAESRAGIDNILLRLVKEYIPGTHPTITADVIGCVESYLVCTSVGKGPLVTEITSRAQKYMNRASRAFVPAEEFRLAACAAVLSTHAASPSIILSLLGSSSSEASNIVILENLWHLQESYSPELVDRVISLGVRGKAGEGIQLKALNVLSEITWQSVDCDALAEWKEKGGRFESVCEALDRIVINSKCVPIREAALVALAWALHHALTNSPGESKKVISMYGRLARYVLRASHEDESQPARFAAYKALTHLTSHLVHLPHPSFHQTLIRLAQDDDEEIRHGAARIIVGMLGGEKSVVQQRAVEMWYDWATRLLLGFDRDSDELGQWLVWISDLAQDHKGYEHDVKTLKGGVDSEVLFEIEPSNIFRDPLVDVFYASRLLSSLRLAGLLGDRLSHCVPETKTRPEIHLIENITQTPTTVTTACDDSNLQSPEHAEYLELDRVAEEPCVSSPSPIDDAWEARGSFMRRKKLQRMIVPKEGCRQESR
ncbi:hypothetical protein CNBE2610 [Cryptococcus deneoformans B-3501A]|uniref:hypothetical protein n=1 Tax=Cryptococcus deneoformans (strain B-3501A) TaxID=283643 RepID=UPI000042EC1E|nr:hypothetical protein CNBE2610 [Cryptococcus neoformans var. neoformans B-3501A]EAL20900.1 hypothetical protein CNBE2610 [Cryptococcus neoformans var. neoformans B-3501A]